MNLYAAHARRVGVGARFALPGGVLSEFYSQRRTSIKDGVGLVSFIIGWFAAAPFAWPYMSAGFEDGGNAARGVLKFVVAVFAAGIGFGAVGLLLGGAAGMVWERWHRRRRSAIPARLEPATAPEPGARPASPAARAPLPALRFDASGLTITEYLALLRRVSPEAHDVARASAAFDRTTNVGAWSGDRPVGAARVLSDGYFHAALADIIVDPDFQRRGVGRELLNRAYDLTPRGTLFVNARNDSTGFFERTGCERGTPGFVMRRAAR